jgi:predicted enzyme related to lactoylglutathione lyase
MATEGLGTFCWFELATTNAAKALDFYRGLFGWEAQTTPLPGGGTYTMLSTKGASVGAAFDMNPALGGHLPPHWNSYVEVENVDAQVARVKELGGSILKEPFDVMGVGRMAVLRDPTGGMLSMWQAKKPEAPRATIDYRAPGRVCWCELQTRGAGGASQFYSQLFGWRLHSKEGADYIQFFSGDSPLGGFFELEGKAGLENIPPNWMVFFSTDDVDASAAKVKELGGRVHMPPMDLPEVGRFAVVADPQGATFTLFRLNPEH